VWHREVRTKDGVQDISIQLANFKARIISDITRDDGVETVRHYEIAATLAGRPFRFEVPATQFGSMRWVHERMGAGAIVSPGQGMRERLHHAIQTLSAGMFEERHVYAHTGWREIDGHMHFLHAGGALGANGHRTDIDVDLPEQLARFDLVEPEDAADRKRAVRESLLLELLAPKRVIAPLLGAIYRAPLGGSDITVALNAPTGRGKTETAAIAQQHFGAGMDARRLPLAWESTSNVLEVVLSAGKDVLVTIDEYVPGESYGARSLLQGKAERVIRAQGNATGRGRMRADTSLRRVRPPRGQLLSTGEEIPTGQSLRARMMIVETSKFGVIGVSAETLGDRLVDKGITVPEREGKRRRNRAKRTVAGQRRRVFHVRAATWLYPPESGAFGAFGAEAENALRDQEVAEVACAPLR
jgi:hypothetical protein